MCIVHLPFCQLDCNNCIFICFRKFDALLLCWNPRMIRQLPCVTLLWFLNTPLALFFVIQGTTFDVTQGTTFFVIQRTKFFAIRGTIFICHTMNYILCHQRNYILCHVRKSHVPLPTCFSRTPSIQGTTYCWYRELKVSLKIESQT